jgi:type I restriction-modification system DNA methylase subunit
VSHQSLTEGEQKNLKDILEDLRYLFSLEEILPEQVDNVLDKLRSEEVRAYIDNLRKGSKPEVALREAFLAGKDAPLTKYLFGHLVPEENIGPGFIDYQVAASPNRFIILELKSLFESEVEVGKGGVRNLVRIKQSKLRPDVHKEQIVKYVRKGGEFVILTNLREWFFYNDNVIVKFEPFHETELLEFVKEFDVTTNIVDYLERNEYESIREDLDKRFFESLKSWVGKLSEVEFDLDEKNKIEAIIGLVNKFIFIQTLDDHGVVDFRWIRSTWEHAEQRWHAKGKLQVLKKFFEEVMDFFWSHYDTELFQGEVLANLKQTEKNIELFYRNLLLVLGLAYWQTGVGGYRGIMQYNFKFIDEDILGKAYETFLADVRHDEGIYYTPRYITRYIVEDAVGRVFRPLLDEMIANIQREDFARTKELSERFISIRVLDPACGSGSFLIKAVRKIWELYKELDSALAAVESKYVKFEGTLVRPKDAEKKLEAILEIRRLLRITNDRELVSHILIRHIHANDLDTKATAVAKVNIWLEAIKLAPKQFRYDTLPEGTNYVLPHLEMNFRNGDSVVGLPENLTIDYLSKNHRERIKQLFGLRNQYVREPTNPDLITKIEEILDKLRSDVDEEFKKCLKAKEMPLKILEQTKPFHWALEFWYMYFKEDGTPFDADVSGADIIVGNPPYERIQVLNKKAPVYVEYLNGAGYESAFKNYDLAVIFVEKGYRLLKRDGEFGYIVTNKFMQADYGEPLRRWLSREMAVREMVDFGDQQVFEDATTYTALLFLRKNPNETYKKAMVTELLKNLDQLLLVTRNESYADSTIAVGVSNHESLTEKAWSTATAAEEPLFKKFDGLDKLDNVCRIFVGLQTSEDSVYILEVREEKDNLVRVYSRANEKEYTLERNFLKPLLMGKDIKRWYIPKYSFMVLFPYALKNGKAELVDQETLTKACPRTWQYLTEKEIKKKLEGRENGRMKGKPDWYGYIYRKNLNKFDLPKVLTQVLASKASFSLDTNGSFYFPGGGNAGGYGIIPKAKGLSLSYLCGLLNSSLLDLYLKRKSSRFRGGFYSYARRFSGQLPIVLPDTKAKKNLAQRIEDTVNRIAVLKSLHHRALDRWNTISIQLKNNERSLGDILTDDGKAIREGRFESVWTKEVTFYPNSHVADQQLSKEFVDFIITADAREPRLGIHGLTDDGSEELVYQAQFISRELMLQVYFSILTVLGSRATVTTLKELLEKTTVPIIQPDVCKNTPNIIKKLEIDSANEDTKRLKVAAHDIAALTDAIETAEAENDASVFKLYGLDEADINLVLRLSSATPSYQEAVLVAFSAGP